LLEEKNKVFKLDNSIYIIKSTIKNKMGWFSGNKEERERTPSLSALPKLPDLGDVDDKIHKLPSLPHSSLGTKFSQDTIKEAVAGEKEDLNYGDDADDFDMEDEDEMRMMQEPLRKPLTEEMWKGSPRSMQFGSESSMGEPVFIRIDNFEEALKIFNQTKKKVMDIEHTLSEIKKIKEREEKELASWENEVQSMKTQIEKADRDIFSKI